MYMKRNFRTMLNELKNLREQLSEDYIFNGDEGMIDNEMDAGIGDEEDQVDPRMVQQQRNSSAIGQGDSEEEVAMHAQEVIQHEPIIGKIRETAIEGLKKYADHPTSSLYEFFKKVFLESDKVLTDTGGKK